MIFTTCISGFVYSFFFICVCSSYWLFNDACILCRNAECLLPLIHLEEHRSAGRNLCSFFITLKSDAIIINTCKTIELTFFYLAQVNGERQAECCPGSAFLHRTAIRCNLGCERLVSHEILAVVKNEIICSKSFSRCKSPTSSTSSVSPNPVSYTRRKEETQPR